MGKGSLNVVNIKVVLLYGKKSAHKKKERKTSYKSLLTKRTICWGVFLSFYLGKIILLLNWYLHKKTIIHKFWTIVSPKQTKRQRFEVTEERQRKTDRGRRKEGERELTVYWGRQRRFEYDLHTIWIILRVGRKFLSQIFWLR